MWRGLERLLDMEKVTGSSPVIPTIYMYTVYVLRSEKNGKRYVGFTSVDIEKRLNWHKWGLTPWTRQNGPFELIYTETYVGASLGI